jgi:uncharacterized paraquat-inducible protein A
MAHGSPRINICKRCKTYIYVPRFSQNPACPECKNITETTTEEKIKKDYKLSFFYQFILTFSKWTKIKK